ncbi:MAG: phosphatidate cytidylyltransferase, partial [Notoacmeibacter sp.]
AAISLVGLRNGNQGFDAIILLFAIVWASDIGAYFVGRKIGGPKLAPKISPGKTRSGAIGGIIVSMIAAGIVAAVTQNLIWSVAVFVAAFVSIISQIGDLFESYLKRRFGVKDSGSIMPGHGGLFDRVDGLMPAAIVLFFFTQLF